MPHALGQEGGEAAWKELVWKCSSLASAQPLRQECSGQGEHGPDQAGPEGGGNAFGFYSKLIGQKTSTGKAFQQGQYLGRS